LFIRTATTNCVLSKKGQERRIYRRSRLDASLFGDPSTTTHCSDTTKLLLIHGITRRQIAFSSLISVPAMTSRLFTGRKMRPVVIPAALSQASTRALTPPARSRSVSGSPSGHVRQHPPSLALLEIFDLDAEQLRAAQAAPDPKTQKRTQPR